MDRMAGKVALVVGGAKGIGLAVAQIGRGAQGIAADAASPQDLERVVAEIQETHGRVDALVLNAGMSEPASLEEVTPDHFDRHFAVNVRGAMLGLHAALKALGDGGAVVLMGSVASSIGLPNYGTYAATKAALRSYARTWAAELAPRGICVNVLSPASTDTDMMARVPEETRAAIIATIPLGRMAKPAEVAAAALFLLGDEASYITGIELFVYGGMGQV